MNGIGTELQNQKTVSVSVIIPFYNTENYIQTCVESVLNQTFQDFEIICVCDGSTDESLDIVKRIMLSTDKIKLIEIENHGQGYARNLAMSHSNGEFILFLDSDDWIEPKTLEISTNRIMESSADMVLFDYRYCKNNSFYKYDTDANVFKKNRLIGSECLQLFEINTFYSCRALYSSDYLVHNNICFLEGYIYEDVPFVAKTILNASHVELIHAPLYCCSINNNSTTRTNVQTDKHYIGYIAALFEIVSYIKNNNLQDDNLYYLYLSRFRQFLQYYEHRVPRKYRAEYTRDFIEIYSDIAFFPDLKKTRFFSYLIKYREQAAKHPRIFQMGVDYLVFVKPVIKKTKKQLKKAKSALQTPQKALKKLLRKKKVPYVSKNDLTQYLTHNNTILFMGFDYRYTGNSRYLFEEMIKNCMLHNKRCLFVTADVRVPAKYRVEPKSERCKQLLEHSKTVIFESWIPLDFKKRPDSNWIQLWHGTPLKKLLFDSNELYITSRNPKNKPDKYKDLQRWDYLLVNNIATGHLFESAFLFPQSKILPYGYPRVKYLIDKQDDLEYRKKLREIMGFTSTKKIVAYLPTWRDRNYRLNQECWDTNYLLNLNELQEALGDGYELVYKDHPFLSTLHNSKFRNMSDSETQELLLIADYLITDYSSVLFDALEIDLPVVLYCKDFEDNLYERGIYTHVWEDVQFFEEKTVSELAKRIREYRIDELYRSCKEKYRYAKGTEKNLTDFIYSL